MTNPNPSDPVIIDSKHSCTFESNGITVEVAIYRLEEYGNEWSLEVIDQRGTSTVWNDTFESDDAAWNEFLKTIEKEGIESIVQPHDGQRKKRDH